MAQCFALCDLPGTEHLFFFGYINGHDQPAISLQKYGVVCYGGQASFTSSQLQLTGELLGGFQ